MQKKYNILTGILLVIIIVWLFLSSNVNFINTYQLWPNIVDFLSNSVIALTSAGIAWFISTHESKKQKIERDFIQNQNNNNNIQAVLIELETNAKILTIAKNNQDIKILEKAISQDIWIKLGTTLVLEQDEFNKLHLLYTRLQLIRFLESFNSDTIENLINDIHATNEKMNLRSTF